MEAIGLPWAMIFRLSPETLLEVAKPSAPTGTWRYSPSAATASAGASPPVSHVRYEGIAPKPWITWLAILVSIGLHAALLLGFNRSAPARKVVVREEIVDQMQMMALVDEPEEAKPKELNDEEPMEAPSITVPLLADIPTFAPSSSSFIQQLDLTIPMKSDPTAGRLVTIPVNIQRGRPDDSAIKNLFNVADLDRRPEPIVQTQPNYPFDMKRAGIGGRVRVGFIVDSQGNVILPYVISSSHREFEFPTIETILKWKFRPGMKSGRKVNTRVEQPLDFIVDQSKTD